jgi:catechol 2,3-dioxygenase-like lactoylglutathione lyase family enzyme
MEQRLTLITLGVANLARSRGFYENGLGWRPVPGDHEGVVFYDLGGFGLALYGFEDLAKDACLPPVTVGSSAMSLAFNVDSAEEVDRILSEALAAGATMLKPGHKVFWGGYCGYFADLDGHVWEIAWNPFWKLDESGRIVAWQV